MPPGEMEEDELVAGSLECRVLEDRVHGAQPLPPVTDGSRVGVVDEIKEDGVARDDAPLYTVQEVPGISHVQRNDLLVSTESQRGDMVWSVNQGIPSTSVVKEIIVHAVVVGASDLGSRSLLCEIPRWRWARLGVDVGDAG